MHLDVLLQMGPLPFITGCTKRVEEGVFVVPLFPNPPNHSDHHYHVM